MPTRGPKPTLTTKVILDACGFIKAGNFPARALQIVGIPSSTAHRWIVDSERVAKLVLENSEVELTDFEEKLWELWEAFQQSEVEAEAIAILELRQAGKKDWKAALAYLERRYPERWRAPEAAQRDAGKLTDDELLKRVQSFRERAGRAGGVRSEGGEV